MTFYKVRHKDSGLFSTGGMDPKFNSRGKTWNRIGDVRCHRAQFRNGYCAHAYCTYLQDTEIVEYRFEVEMQGEAVIPD